MVSIDTSYAPSYPTHNQAKGIALPSLLRYTLDQRATRRAQYLQHTNMHSSKAATRCARLTGNVLRCPQQKRNTRYSARYFATAQEPVARFKGTKGSDVDNQLPRTQQDVQVDCFLG